MWVWTYREDRWRQTQISKRWINSSFPLLIIERDQQNCVNCSSSPSYYSFLLIAILEIQGNLPSPASQIFYAKLLWVIYSELPWKAMGRDSSIIYFYTLSFINCILFLHIHLSVKLGKNVSWCFSYYWNILKLHKLIIIILFPLYED